MTRREKVARAIYEANEIGLVSYTPWNTFPNWQKDHYYRLADAAIAAMEENNERKD